MELDIDLREETAYIRFQLQGDELPLGARNQKGGFAKRALDLAQLVTEPNGAVNATKFEFTASPGITSEPSGGTTIHLRQICQGIAIFNAEQTVGFSPGDEIDHTQARIVAVHTPPEQTIVITADRAVFIAAQFVGGGAGNDAGRTDEFGQSLPKKPLALEQFAPTILVHFPNLAELPIVFEAGPFAEPIQANLVWFPLSTQLRLSWELTLTMPDFDEAFQILVAADDGSVLFCKQLIAHLTHRGSIYTVNPDRPRDLVDFPRPWDVYGLGQSGLLPAVPPLWVSTDRTEGYSVQCFLADTRETARGTLVSGDIDFTAADALGRNQAIINAFYGCCFMHDFMYFSGFRESDGSYQEGGSFAGIATAPIKVAVSAAPVFNLANWWRGTIHLGPHGTTERHTGLDMTILMHEYAHAVSSRLVGGSSTPNPFVEPQSKGMSEGWSDYIACAATGAEVIGGWTSGDDQKGIRRFAYSLDFPVEMANFGILATLKPYEVCELWCAFLMDFTRKIGRILALSLVIDGMKGLISNPSLLDGRNNILLKLQRRLDANLLDEQTHRATKLAIWTAAAKFGMGANATSNGASLVGAVADTSAPSL